MKRALFVLMIIALSLCVVACSVDTKTGYVSDAIEGYHGAKSEGMSGMRRDSYEYSYGGYGEAAMPDGYLDVTSDGIGGNDTPRAGLLTACAYADQEYNAFWQGLLTSNQQGAGKYAGYFNDFAFKALRQVKVTVEGIAGAKVSLVDEDKVLSTARTDNAGVAYLFAPSGTTEGLLVKVETADAEGNLLTFDKTVENGEAVFAKEETIEAAANHFNRIEVMFVIDTTGSMGDEFVYLKQEIDDVIGRIKSETGAEVLLAVMVYRDDGDEYVTRYSDFTTDIAAQQAFLSKQGVDGGGDFEEAVDKALTEAVNKQWSKNATKLIVHVADAPAHDKDVDTWHKAAEKAADNGIRIVTVASSGIDEKTEYFFRAQSLMTGGVYIWLTDDSGIGGEHLEATVEHRPAVEALNDCIVRVVKSLHVGGESITLPAPAEEQPTEPEQAQPTEPEQAQPEQTPAE